MNKFNLAKKLMLPLIAGIASVNVFAATPAYFALYGLNNNPTMLSDVVQTKDKIQSVDAGFILIKANTNCNIQNISDGTSYSPLSSSHIADIQKFVSNGGSFGLIFGGSIGSSGSVQDPLIECSQPDLVTLIQQSISATGTTVSRVNFDIETNFTNLPATYWSNLSTTISQLNSSNPDLKIVLSIPEWSDYWSAGYTPAMKQFFANLPANTSVNIMMSQTGGDSSSITFAQDTISTLGIPAAKATIMLDPSDGTINTNDFNNLAYAGTTFLLNANSGDLDNTMVADYQALN